MVRFPGKEVYTDRYGPIPQTPPVSQDWGFEEASGEDAYLGLEDSGLTGLEQGQPVSRADDEALLGDIAGALGGAGDEVEAETAKALSDLKEELWDEAKSELVDEVSLGKWRERAEALSQKLLKGTGFAEEILEAVEELRAEWQEAVETGQEAAEARDEGLSKPRKVDAKRKTAIYDADPVTSLRVNYDDKVKVSEVTAGKVTLTGATMADSFVVRFDEAASCYVVTAAGKNKKGATLTEEFRIDDSQLEILTLPSNRVDVSALSDAQLAKLRIGADPKPARQSIAVAWPEGGIAGFIPDSDHARWARAVAELIDGAALGKSTQYRGDGRPTEWADVVKYIDNELRGDGTTGYNAKPDRNIQDQELMNDVVRKVVTAIYRASRATSEDDPRFLKLLQKIPQDVRRVLMDWVTKETGEAMERQGGEQWNSQQTYDRIQASIDLENGKEEQEPVGSTTASNVSSSTANPE
ncbi:hypothetical protein FBR05_09060 [Deltaproteobacteria bacterium PRO3]|nr:hypothetical protein [Deltaproteobacteria bacterium PRO3]